MVLWCTRWCSCWRSGRCSSGCCEASGASFSWSMSHEASFTNTTSPTFLRIALSQLESATISPLRHRRPADGKESDSLQEVEAAWALLVQSQGLTLLHPPGSALPGSPRPRGRRSFSRLSLLCPRVSSQMVHAQNSSPGGILTRCRSHLGWLQRNIGSSLSSLRMTKLLTLSSCPLFIESERPSVAAFWSA